MKRCNCPTSLLRPLVAVLISAAAAPSCGAASSGQITSPAPAKSLCSISTSTLRAGSFISFQAVASTDLHHGITLTDKACPTAGLKVGRADEGADRSVNRFFKQLQSLAPYMTWRSAHGRFTGRVTLTDSGTRQITLFSADNFQEVAYER